MRFKITKEKMKYQFDRIISWFKIYLNKKKGQIPTKKPLFNLDEIITLSQNEHQQSQHDVLLMVLNHKLIILYFSHHHSNPKPKNLLR